jgi:hypothetical protein
MTRYDIQVKDNEIAKLLTQTASENAVQTDAGRFYKARGIARAL